MNVRVDEGRCILVLRTRRGKARAGLAHAAETATALAAVLERRLLLDRALHSNAQMLAAVDRRVTRLGFDLHDGPLQGVALISGELEHLNRQLALLVADDNARAVARRRVTDLADIAAEVARELRELARAAGGKGGEPLGSQLERCADDLGRRFGIGVELAIDGDVDRITESQRIAVARVVEEALANVGEHSGAGRAGVVVRRGPDGIHLVVEDDGKGFDVSRARTRAASEGRLGLQSMHERIRMLGGSLDISSRRGGPTVVTAVLPAWDGR